MKILNTLPTDQAFYDQYAPLARRLRYAGHFAQLVSGATEIGIIYTAGLRALAPLHLDYWAYPIAGALALLGVIVIEGGLFESFPKAVDAVLYRRTDGLHLPITVFVWLLSLVLFTTSGLLSFKNSSVIVDQFTPAAEQVSTTAADSTRQAEAAQALAAYRSDSLLLAQQYQANSSALAESYAARIEAQRERLAGLERREARTGNSYATAKDRTRQAIADLQAERSAALAELASDQGAALQDRKQTYTAELAGVQQAHRQAVTEITSANEQAQAERTATVSTYGGGLGWFTVVCLFLFSVSVILDRIFRKGAGIGQKVMIENRDFAPSWWQAALSAIWERWDYWVHSRITAFADRTPAPPLPAQPAPVYDLSEALQNIRVNVVVNMGEDEDEPPTIVIDPKTPAGEPQRRQIGFQHTTNHGPQNSAANAGPFIRHEKTTNHEPPNHEKNPDQHPRNTHETPDLRHAKQQLKKYKKRLGSHQQKARIQQRKNGEVTERTLKAIDNNKAWVQHWTNEINKLEK